MSADPLHRTELALIAYEIAAPLRHDLRNKLGSIRNAAFYVRRKLSKTEAWTGDPRLAQMASLLDEEVAAANAIVDAGEARLFTRNPAPIDLRTCVLRAVEHARVRSHRIDVDAAPVEAVVDPDEAAVAIRCLIENAVEAAPTGDVRVAAVRDGGVYRVEITDDGPGVPEADLESILKPYSTTKPGHAGLGLAIARRVATRTGGRLSLSARSPGISAVLTLGLGGEHGDPAR